MLSNFVVRGVGLEPTRLIQATDFKSVLATSYNTRASFCQVAQPYFFISSTMSRLETMTVWAEDT